MFQKEVFDFQLFNLCDYTRAAPKKITVQVWAPTQYGDASTRMVILRAWVMTYIYRLLSI